MYDFGFRKSPSGYAQNILIVNLAFDTLKFSTLSNQTWRCIERYIRIKIRPKPCDEILSEIGRTFRIGTYGSNNSLPRGTDQRTLRSININGLFRFLHSSDFLRANIQYWHSAEILARPHGHGNLADQMLLSILSEFHPIC